VFRFFKELWKKNWKGKTSLILGAVFFLAISIAVPYAVITRQGDEGFLKDPQGRDIKWPKSSFPLICIYAESVKDSHLELYDKARREYNDRVGIELFGPCIPWLVPNSVAPKYADGGLLLRVERPPEEQKRLVDGVVIVVETPWKIHPGGRALPLSRKDQPNIIVAVPVWIAPAHADNPSVWLHELGHALGLKHDRLRDSIMWPIIQDRPGRLSDKDVSALVTALK